MICMNMRSSHSLNLLSLQSTDELLRTRIASVELIESMCIIRASKDISTISQPVVTSYIHSPFVDDMRSGQANFIGKCIKKLLLILGI